MIEAEVIKNEAYILMKLRGRLDSMTSQDIEKKIIDISQAGARVMAFSLGEVNFISSAGLRIFMTAGRNLKQAGGEAVFTAVPGKLKDVFKMGGFDRIFRFFDTEEDLKAEFGTKDAKEEKKSAVFGDLKIEYAVHKKEKGSFRKIGSMEKLDSSEYTLKDAVGAAASSVRFGAGLAAVGDDFNEYKDYFGEAVVLNHSLFYYPAVKNPSADFMLGSPDENSVRYKFLNGFAVNGDYAVTAEFESEGAFPGVEMLVDAMLSLVETNAAGMVIIAESKGFWGMNLRRVPILENKPENGNIFSQENFTQWINFPVEPAEIGNIIISFGIAVKELAKAPKEIIEILPEGQNFKFTSAVFEKELLGKNAEKLDEDISRISMQAPILKVQRMLAKTRFGSGMAGVVEIS